MCISWIVNHLIIIDARCKHEDHTKANFIFLAPCIVIKLYTIN